MGGGRSRMQRQHAATCSLQQLLTAVRSVTQVTAVRGWLGRNMFEK